MAYEKGAWTKKRPPQQRNDKATVKIFLYFSIKNHLQRTIYDEMIASLQ